MAGVHLRRDPRPGAGSVVASRPAAVGRHSVAGTWTSGSRRGSEAEHLLRVDRLRHLRDPPRDRPLSCTRSPMVDRAVPRHQVRYFRFPGDTVANRRLVYRAARAASTKTRKSPPEGRSGGLHPEGSSVRELPFDAEHFCRRRQRPARRGRQGGQQRKLPG